MPTWHNRGMELILIVFLTLLNGVFAMSEMALASVRKARLAALQEAGDKGADSAMRLLEEPTRFLSTVQVGITSIGVLNGIVGEAAFSAGVAQALVSWGMGAPAASITATAVVVTVITFITIIFGELVPKRIGQLYPERVARLVARPMTALSRMAGPFVRLLSLSTQGVLRLLRINSQGRDTVTEEEITASLEEGVDAGLIEAHEHQMVRNVFHLDDRPLTSLMTPRSDIQWLEAAHNAEQALAVINSPALQDGHSWYPVCKDGLAHVVGLISTARLLSLAASGQLSAIETQAQPAVFVPETRSAMELLEQLRDHSARMLLVVDEYGEVQGLITPRDLLEAITGELKPDTPLEAWATPQPEGGWLLDGRMPVNELKARLGIRELPDEDRGLYNTVAGLVLFGLGELPRPGAKYCVEGWLFEVLSMQARRIEQIHATPMPQAEN